MYKSRSISVNFHFCEVLLKSQICPLQDPEGDQKFAMIPTSQENFGSKGIFGSEKTTKNPVFSKKVVLKQYKTKSSTDFSSQLGQIGVP